MPTACPGEVGECTLCNPPNQVPTSESELACSWKTTGQLNLIKCENIGKADL